MKLHHPLCSFFGREAEGGDFLGFDLLVAVANSPIAGSYLEMVDVSSNVENDQIEA